MAWVRGSMRGCADVAEENASSRANVKESKMVSKIQESEPGAWKNTVTGVGLGRKLFTYEEGGTLYATSAKLGSFKPIGEGYNTRILLADGTDEGLLYAIENSGTLYQIDPSSGEWEQIGEDEAWADVVAADASDGTVYYVDDEGSLFAMPVDGGDATELGEGYDTKALYFWQGYVYVLENDGSLYKVDAETGEYELFGAEGAYDDTLAATIHQGVFYAVEDDGALGATNLEDGVYQELTGADLSDVRHLFSASGNLYGIDNAGTLQRISP
jgi:outer membrane protein assembly factor BamB